MALGAIGLSENFCLLVVSFLAAPPNEWRLRIGWLRRSSVQVPLNLTWLHSSVLSASRAGILLAIRTSVFNLCRLCPPCPLLLLLSLVN